MDERGHTGRRRGPLREEGPADRAGVAEVFDRHRPLLFSIAYRMLGSVMEAEDVVQEAFVRWQRASGTEVRSPKSYLSAVVTRLCIDQLRSARTRREEYVGPWLPEPLLAEQVPNSVDTAGLEESLSMAFLVLLESLSPEERAVFLLREVFDYDYPEVSRIVGKSEANCRQISHRAREAVVARRPRFAASAEKQERITRQFIDASSEGDMEGLLCLLAEDVVLYSDGGGRVPAARNAVVGSERVARFVLGLARKAPPGFVIRPAQINGLPGIVGYADGAPIRVLSLEIADDLVRAVRLVVNPDKLRSVPRLPEE